MIEFVRKVEDFLVLRMPKNYRILTNKIVLPLFS